MRRSIVHATLVVEALGLVPILSAGAAQATSSPSGYRDAYGLHNGPGD